MGTVPITISGLIYLYVLIRTNRGKFFCTRLLIVTSVFLKLYVIVLKLYVNFKKLKLNKLCGVRVP